MCRYTYRTACGMSEDLKLQLSRHFFITDSECLVSGNYDPHRCVAVDPQPHISNHMSYFLKAVVGYYPCIPMNLYTHTHVVQLTSHTHVLLHMSYC